MIVGLTGGIGSGKTTVSKIFGLLGCAVFDSDAVAKQVYFEDAIKTSVIQLLGPNSYSSPDKINRAYIASRVFKEKELLQQLNAIIHPAVLVRTKRFAEQNEGKVIIKETALLFEAGLTKEVDKIIVVAAPDEMRINRVMQRDGSKREEIISRIQSQIKQADKIAQAQFVIHNDEQSLLIPVVVDIYNQLQSAL